MACIKVNSPNPLKFGNTIFGCGSQDISLNGQTLYWENSGP